MKLHLIWLAVIVVLVAQTAQAGHLGFGRGGPGLGGHHHGFGGGDLLGGDLFGGVGLDTERLQTSFETKFESLQIDYDTGLADIEDFYSSDAYTDVVDGVERLSDRYDLFLSGVERSIDRIGDFLTIANDDLTYYDELIAKYEARDDLSEERLERIIDRLTGMQDRLTTKIDFLTEKQTTLSENLTSYQTFSGDVSNYLSEIVLAGGGITETAAVLRSVAPVALLGDETSHCEMSEGALAATAAPEPATSGLGIVALGLLALRRPRRRRPGD